MGHEICYFCHHDYDRHECYPLFGKYYICRECQDMVRDGVRLFIDANRVKETQNANRPTV